MPQKIRIIGVPMDLGASRRGVDMGPSALRVAGLQARIKQLGVQVEDIGNISVKQPEEMPVGEKRAKYVEEITDACKDLGAAVQKAIEEGFLPLVLGGDHSIAAGSVSGVAAHFKKGKEADRLHLAGRPQRHEFAGDLSFGKRPRHAVGLHLRLRSSGAL